MTGPCPPHSGSTGPCPPHSGSTGPCPPSFGSTGPCPVEVVFSARAALVPPAVEYLAGVAGVFGLEPAACLRLSGAVEEACANVVRHAFAAGEEGTIRIQVERLPGALSVRVHDQGLPADLADLAQGRGLGFGGRVMQAFADEVRFHNLGARGKCVELIKRLPQGGGEAASDPSPVAPPSPGPAGEVEVTLRFMRPEEALQLARLIYHAYGYSYFSEHVYHPEKTRELIERGLLVSCLAVTSGGEVVGHCGLVFERTGDRVAESAVAAVLPGFRGRSLFERMKRFLMEAARAGLPGPGPSPRTLYGLFSEGATIHPYTQKVNHRIGARETGLLLAYAPASMQFKAIEGGARSVRQSVLTFYVRTLQEPRREVYLPPRHRAMIRRIHQGLGFERVPVEAPPGWAPPAASEVESRFRREWGQGSIQVHRCGVDLAGHVREQVRLLLRQKAECLLLDLPLSDPGTPAACEALEPLGFFFGGLLPEARPDGDVLRLQLLHDVEPDLDVMHAVSDFARELRDYVVACMPEPPGGGPRPSANPLG